MKKILVSLFVVLAMAVQVNAATWVAKDRVAPVGQQLLTKNGISIKLTFNVVEGAADNSETAKTNVVNISSELLKYAGNDNEVAAAIANELGHIICCHSDKSKLLSYVLGGSDAQNEATNTVGTDIISAKMSQKVQEEADVTGVNLMINAGYNPLALIVWVTKQPGSAMDVLKSRPNNFDRAMTTYKYLTYAYPDKVKAGYGCQEYRNFLASADPEMKKLTKSKRKLKKFNKEQAKLIQERKRDLEKYKLNGGLNSWGVTYDLLTAPTEPAKTEPEKK